MEEPTIHASQPEAGTPAADRSAQEPKKVKQFDLSHLTVDDKLQGARLSSFSRRFWAYGLDWFFVVLAVKFLPLLAVILLVNLLRKKRLSHVIERNRRLLRIGVERADRRFAKLEADEKLRARFRKVMPIYLQVLIYGPVVLGAFIFLGSFWGLNTEVADGKALSDNVVARSVEDMYSGLSLLFNVVGGALYFTVFTWLWRGQTPAKRLLGIRAVRLNGRKMTLWNSFERFSGYAASASMAGAGFFQYYWDQNRQTTHDKIAETIVIRE